MHSTSQFGVPKARKPNLNLANTSPSNIYAATCSYMTLFSMGKLAQIQGFGDQLHRSQHYDQSLFQEAQGSNQDQLLLAGSSDKFQICFADICTTMMCPCKLFGHIPRSKTNLANMVTILDILIKPNGSVVHWVRERALSRIDRNASTGYESYLWITFCPISLTELLSSSVPKDTSYAD